MGQRCGGVDGQGRGGVPWIRMPMAATDRFIVDPTLARHGVWLLDLGCARLVPLLPSGPPGVVPPPMQEPPAAASWSSSILTPARPSSLLQASPFFPMVGAPIVQNGDAY
ncbi:unnamed protein product [Urochloa humidicola]